MKILNRLSKLFLFGLFSFFLFVFCGINKKSINTFYNKPDKIWAHRGLSINFPENSLQSIQAAYKYGFKGVEIDIWYNSKLKSFDVKHDMNSSGQPLLLDSVFNKFKNKNLYFWLDMKNLDKNNYTKILNKLNYYNEKYKIQKYVIIESSNAYYLNQLTKNNFFTSLYLKPLINIPLYQYLQNNFINLIHICLYNYSALSMPALAYNKFNRFLFRKKNIHLWYQTKDVNQIRNWIKFEEVKIILFDGVY